MGSLENFLDDVWGLNKLYITEEPRSILCSQSASIILSVNPNNIDRYLRLETFKEIFKKMQMEVNEYSIQLMQLSALNGLHEARISAAEVKKYIGLLHREGTVDSEHWEALQRRLDSIKVEDDDKELSTVFQKSLSTLNEICRELESHGHKNRLDTAYKNANEQKFFIAITGVINAGKSSTLNALMQQSILGVSNIPETANLSVITYNDEETGKIIFWNEEEQKSMNLNPRQLEDKVVEIGELKKYTTAKSEISPFVKEVVVGLPLEILKDGINIVDTPGLDDAVVLREELTRDYMQRSDFIIHLMNASQSATKKDIDFVCQTLRSGKSTGLIIALTHVDKLKESDLEEVLAYTKRSIDTQMKEHGLDPSLSEDIRFFLVSAVSGQGIDELRHHIYKSFFGADSMKANLIIDSYKKELLHIAQELRDSAKAELALISTKKVQSDVARLEYEIQTLDSNVRETTEELNTLIKRLDYKDIDESSAIKSISDKIRDRIVNDVQYCKNNKKKIDEERICTICQSGFEDCFIDLFRDFRHRVSRDMHDIYEVVKLRISVENKDINITKNMEEFLERNMPEIDYDDVKKSLIAQVKKTQDMAALAQELSAIFARFIDTLKLRERLDELVSLCTDEFVRYIHQESSRMKATMKTKQVEMQRLLQETVKEMESTSERRSQLEREVELISDICDRVEAC